MRSGEPGAYALTGSFWGGGGRKSPGAALTGADCRLGRDVALGPLEWMPRERFERPRGLTARPPRRHRERRRGNTVSVTRVAYAAEGWGEGELWFEGKRLVWHELPRPRPNQPGTHPHPGGAQSRLPLRSTIPAKGGRVGDQGGPKSEQLVHMLRRYFAGERVDFDRVDSLDLDGLSPFQRAIARALRAVPYGEVVSYAELARAAGHPNAQRAAGTFCAHNRYPLILPCHRVVAAKGLGAYGSLGVEYKRRLLELEGVAL
jgi:methylated-DNA-[protein]-cysteine S-methyltransferase